MLTADGPVAGAVRYHLKFGPITVTPGQNNNVIANTPLPKPPVSGWLVRYDVNLERVDGSVPAVDVIHLHHGVFLNVSKKDLSAPFLPERFAAAGEEKTVVRMPAGFGYRVDAKDMWVVNYMIHNQVDITDQVYLTYDMDVIADTASQATGIKAVRPVWMDVWNGSAYPVFDVAKGSGTSGTYTYPDQATAPYGSGTARNEWVADRDLTLVGTGVHVHPGGLYGELKDTRGDQTVRLFKSEAHYFDEHGPVSWDLAVTTTPATWRVGVKQGDKLSVSATYETSLASWFESMGIMVVWAAEGADGAPDPFTTPVDVPGEVNHGQLPENRNKGGATAGLPDPAALPTQRVDGTVPIDAFTYGLGDFSEGTTTIPEVVQGTSITFDNKEWSKANGIWHTITACKAPCNRSTGIAYPLADADVIFDSGQLGDAGAPTAGRATWSTPADLSPGVYTYFCRIHPFMRGAFKVVPSA